MSLSLNLAFRYLSKGCTAHILISARTTASSFSFIMGHFFATQHLHQYVSAKNVDILSVTATAISAPASIHTCYPNTARSSVIAEIARITVRLVTAIDRLTL